MFNVYETYMEVKCMDIKNKKLSQDEFFKTRKEVLNGWDTGKDVDLNEAYEYLKRFLRIKTFVIN